MAYLYSLVIDNDSETDTALFYNEAARGDAILHLCAALWDEADLGPMPATWEEAWDALDSHGCDTWISLQEHLIDPAQLEA